MLLPVWIVRVTGTVPTVRLVVLVAAVPGAASALAALPAAAEALAAYAVAEVPAALE